ncbi:PepSY domain-containing protein [Pseudooctadecabacter sp.]|uniref:PepSY domain-containing protein n=1 Tax=Pseudooctadecabacter sp. TaxID=1966338 RepID=UPI0035C7E2D8
MNMKLIAGGALTGLVLAGGIAGMVSAQSAADATGLTEDQIIEIALMEVAGEVTEVELENRRGTQFYEVEILAEDGSEMEVKIAADTGEVLKVEAEDRDCDKDDDDDDDSEDA